MAYGEALRANSQHHDRNKREKRAKQQQLKGGQADFVPETARPMLSAENTRPGIGMTIVTVQLALSCILLRTVR